MRRERKRSIMQLQRHVLPCFLPDPGADMQYWDPQPRIRGVTGSDAWRSGDSGAWPPCSETGGSQPRARLQHAMPPVFFFMDEMH
jgi:hypothetical protein